MTFLLRGLMAMTSEFDTGEEWGKLETFSQKNELLFYESNFFFGTSFSRGNGVFDAPLQFTKKKTRCPERMFLCLPNSSSVPHLESQLSKMR